MLFRSISLCITALICFTVLIVYTPTREIITHRYNETTTVINGKDGKDGKDGSNGANGANGQDAPVIADIMTRKLLTEGVDYTLSCAEASDSAEIEAHDIETYCYIYLYLYEGGAGNSSFGADYYINGEYSDRARTFELLDGITFHTNQGDMTAHNITIDTANNMRATAEFTLPNYASITAKLRLSYDGDYRMYMSVEYEYTSLTTGGSYVYLNSYSLTLSYGAGTETRVTGFAFVFDYADAFGAMDEVLIDFNAVLILEGEATLTAAMVAECKKPYPFIKVWINGIVEQCEYTETISDYLEIKQKWNGNKQFIIIPTTDGSGAITAENLSVNSVIKTAVL